MHVCETLWSRFNGADRKDITKIYGAAPADPFSCEIDSAVGQKNNATLCTTQPHKNKHQKLLNLKKFPSNKCWVYHELKTNPICSGCKHHDKPIKSPDGIL